jgi:TPR repeat protein
MASPRLTPAQILDGFIQVYHTPLTDYVNEYLAHGDELVFEKLSVRIERMQRLDTDQKLLHDVIKALENKATPRTTRETFFLGYAHENGMVVKQDFEKCRQYYEAAAKGMSEDTSSKEEKRDQGIAKSNLASLYSPPGRGVKADEEKALILAREGKYLGSIHALCNMKSYLDSQYEKLYQQGYSLNNRGRADLRMVACAAERIVCEGDLAKAAAAGYEGACNALLRQTDGQVRDADRHIWENAAKAGHSDALAKLALLCKDEVMRFRMTFHASLVTANLIVDVAVDEQEQKQARTTLNELARQNPEWFRREAQLVDKERIEKLLDDLSVLNPSRSIPDGVVSTMIRTSPIFAAVATSGPPSNATPQIPRCR